MGDKKNSFNNLFSEVNRVTIWDDLKNVLPVNKVFIKGPSLQGGFPVCVASFSVHCLSSSAVNRCIIALLLE